MINKIKRVKDLLVKFKGLTTMGSAYFVSQAISVIFWFFIARLLGAEHYGEVSYYIAIASIATTISFLGAGNTLLIYTAKGIKIQSTIYFMTIISSLIISIIIFFMFYNVGVSLFVVGNVIFGMITSELLGLKLFKKYSIYLIT